MKKTTPIFAIALMFASCAQMENVQSKHSSGEGILEEKDVFTFRTPDVEVFAQALSASLRESPSLVHEIREYALKKFDGDYDILYRDLANVTVSASTKSGADMSVEELLLSNLEGMIPTKSAGDFLEQLQEDYPLLQISVPVHAEDLTDDMIPTVVYIPVGVPESQIKYVYGYNSDGDEVKVDAVHEPEEPVIVVGYNERISLTLKEKVDSTLSVPSNLLATATSNSIILTWDAASGVDGYKVYRKDPNSDTFRSVKTISGINNTVFEDLQLSPTTTYFYYVVSYKSGGSKLQSDISTPSNRVSAISPNIPSPISTLEAMYCGNNIEVHWGNQGLTNYTVNLSYQDPFSSTEYHALATTNGTECRYAFVPPFRGRQMNICATRENNIGVSENNYTYIYPPYRNSAATSFVYNNGIFCETLDGLESWISGAPEFVVTVFGIDANGQAVKLDGDFLYPFEERTLSQAFRNRCLYRWDYNMYNNAGWYSAITFFMIEKDTDFPMDITVSVKAPIKLSSGLNLEAAVGLSFKYDSNGQQCGSSSIVYYEYPNKLMMFPNHGVRMYVSENPEL